MGERSFARRRESLGPLVACAAKARNMPPQLPPAPFEKGQAIRAQKKALIFSVNAVSYTHLTLPTTPYV